MAASSLHRIERDDRHFVLDTETCFCFECDGISWDVLAHYPHTPTNHIVHLLDGKHPAAEVEEVIGELEWLRSTQSILPVKKQQDQLKAFEFTPGLRSMEVDLSGVEAHDAPLRDGALSLLLGRSGVQRTLEIVLYVETLQAVPEWLGAWGKHAFDLAVMAGKELGISLVHTAPERGKGAADLEGSDVAVAYTFRGWEGLNGTLAQWKRIARATVARPAKDLDGCSVSVQLSPRQINFSAATEYLAAQGYGQIDLDLIPLYGKAAADAVVAELERTARSYAHDLLKQKRYRLEPIARLFHQIYEGKPRGRTDDSGTHRMAVDYQGDIYPSRHFCGQLEYRIGSLRDGHFNEDRRVLFDDLGALTTSGCGACWARNLCGGGQSAVHLARSGAIRQPDPVWCDAQRAWYGAAIAAFNLLSAEGVDFARLYQGMRPGKRPSLWGMARAALTMKVGLRPIEEADGALLTRWENWSEATYFLGNEYGVFLATRYDREMDSLHPRGVEQEFVIISRQGAPMGLLKLRPDHLPGVARIWIFLEDSAGYDDKGIRRSFTHLLREAAKQGAFKSLIAASGPGDGGLGDFLGAIGFTEIGIEREALFLHDAYHDITLHHLNLET